MLSVLPPPLKLERICLVPGGPEPGLGWGSKPSCCLLTPRLRNETTVNQAVRPKLIKELSFPGQEPAFASQAHWNPGWAEGPLLLPKQKMPLPVSELQPIKKPAWEQEEAWEAQGFPQTPPGTQPLGTEPIVAQEARQSADECFGFSLQYP